MSTKGEHESKGVKRKATVEEYARRQSPTIASGKEEKPAYITWEASRLSMHSSAEDRLVDDLSSLRNLEFEAMEKRIRLFEELSKELSEEESVVRKFLDVQFRKKRIASQLQNLEKQLRSSRIMMKEKDTELKHVRAKIKMSRQAMVTSVQRKYTELRRAEAVLQENIKTFESTRGLENDLMFGHEVKNGLLEKELELEKEKTTCQICMVNGRNSLVLPCMHFLYCDACLHIHQRESQTCPCCRTRITAVLHCKLGIQ